MRHSLILTITILILLIFACNKAQIDTTIDSSLLVNCWKHSYEEETNDDFDIYRPCIFGETPLSRYRQIFDLRGDQKAEYSVLAPNDAHTTMMGTWNYNSATRMLQILDANGEIAHEYEIMAVESERLLLR